MMGKEKNFGIKPLVVLGLLFLFWGVNNLVYSITGFVVISFLILDSFTYVGNFVSGISFIIFGYMLYDEFITFGMIKLVIEKKELE